MNKFEEKEMKKIRAIKNTWYDWLINYIPQPIRKGVDCFKDKVISLFKANTPKQKVYGDGKKFNKSEEKEEENYNKLKRESNIYNKNYIEHKSNGDTNKNLTLK